jgi:hypothetical protein
MVPSLVLFAVQGRHLAGGCSRDAAVIVLAVGAAALGLPIVAGGPTLLAWGSGG